jgi:hypothetical protein
LTNAKRAMATGMASFLAHYEVAQSVGTNRTHWRTSRLVKVWFVFAIITLGAGKAKRNELLGMIRSKLQCNLPSSEKILLHHITQCIMGTALVHPLGLIAVLIKFVTR